MSDKFLHGVEVLEVNSGPRPIRTVRSSVIGLVGTAPDADPAVFPVNTPVLVAGSRLKAAKLDTTGDGLGTLPAAMDGIFDQIGAVVVVIRVEEGADEAATLTNLVGGVNATTGAYEGVHGLLAVESILGYTPRIIAVPGYTSQNFDGVTLNPVVAELTGILDRLGAIAIIDGTNTTDEDAFKFTDAYDSARLYVVDPAVKVFANGVEKVVPASAHVAGLIAKSDNDRGFWYSPSNQVINGIVGTARPIDFKMGDANARANLLNEKDVATIIRQDGYRLWGNRTLSSDPKWAFLSVRRTADMINESLQAAHLWAIDRNITKTYLDDVTESVNAYLRYLTNIGAILGGTCWADEELNTADQIAQGKVYFNFKFTPPYPAEHIIFNSELVNDYIKEIFA